jgi:DNA-directed RNA polymerase specialized sigma24 family protein
MKLASPPRLQLRAATRPRRGTQAPALPLVETRVRARVAGALRVCSAREQLVLVLLLYERLTPAEAATALGLTPRQVERAYHAALADLRRALRGPRTGRPSRAIARRSLLVAARLRKAS